MILACVAVVTVVLFPFLGRATFRAPMPGQFVINVKMPSGTRIELSNNYIARVEDIIRQVVPKRDLNMIVSNIGITPDLSSIYTSNSTMDTGFVQISLKEGHKTAATNTWIASGQNCRARCPNSPPTFKEAAWWTR